MNNVKVAKELLRLAKELVSQDKTAATLNLDGKMFKSVFSKIHKYLDAHEIDDVKITVDGKDSNGRFGNALMHGLISKASVSPSKVEFDVVLKNEGDQDWKWHVVMEKVK